MRVIHQSQSIDQCKTISWGKET